MKRWCLAFLTLNLLVWSIREGFWKKTFNISQSKLNWDSAKSIMWTGYHVTTRKGLIFPVLRQDWVKSNKSQQHSTTWKSAPYLDGSHSWWLCKTSPNIFYYYWGTHSPQLLPGTTKPCKVRTFTSFGYHSACSLQRITRVVQLP